MTLKLVNCQLLRVYGTGVFSLPSFFFLLSFHYLRGLFLEYHHLIFSLVFCSVWHNVHRFKLWRKQNCLLAMTTIKSICDSYRVTFLFFHIYSFIIWLIFFIYLIHSLIIELELIKRVIKYFYT